MQGRPCSHRRPNHPLADVELKFSEVGRIRARASAACLGGYQRGCRSPLLVVTAVVTDLVETTPTDRDWSHPLSRRTTGARFARHPKNDKPGTVPGLRATAKYESDHLQRLRLLAQRLAQFTQRCPRAALVGVACHDRLARLRLRPRRVLPGFPASYRLRLSRSMLGCPEVAHGCLLIV